MNCTELEAKNRFYLTEIHVLSVKRLFDPVCLNLCTDLFLSISSLYLYIKLVVVDRVPRILGEKWIFTLQIKNLSQGIACVSNVVMDGLEYEQHRIICRACG